MDKPLDAMALPFLDDALSVARDAVARYVDRCDAIRDLQEIAVGMQAQLRHPPSLAELIDQPTEKERGRVRSLLTRSTTEGEDPR